MAVWFGCSAALFFAASPRLIWLGAHVDDGVRRPAAEKGRSDVLQR